MMMRWLFFDRLCRVGRPASIQNELVSNIFLRHGRHRQSFLFVDINAIRHNHQIMTAELQIGKALIGSFKINLYVYYVVVFIFAKTDIFI